MISSRLVRYIAPLGQRRILLRNKVIGQCTKHHPVCSSVFYPYRHSHFGTMAATIDSKLQHYLADNPPTVVPLAIKEHFDALSLKEKLYAHYLSLASCAGYRVAFRQVSPESEPLYDLILDLHKHCDGDWNKLAKETGVAEEDLQHFLNFAAQVLGNGGNFKSFGDTQFIPRLQRASFKNLASASSRSAEIFEHWGDSIYADDTKRMHLGYQEDGHTTTYYPRANPMDPYITKQEISVVSDFLAGKGLLPENTRIQRTRGGDFDVLIASAEKKPTEQDVDELTFRLPEPLKDRMVNLVYGDHTAEMQKVVKALRQATSHTANATQEEMLNQYTKSFFMGSMEAFKNSQRAWIKDKNMAVECNIGFIETYRDPQGIRGEWEGLVSMVNKERTKAFKKLVDAAPRLIPKLPWSKEFEKNKFLSPEFTSLEVLTFAGTGPPAGINLPNFDDIRQVEGFKNVSLNNVLSASAPDEKIPFVHPDEIELFRKHRDMAFEVQVGLHELLGHGCGKLLQETSPDEYNFDHENPPTNPLTGKPVLSWYKPGQTYMGLFGGLGSSFEECRAEVVAMCLVCDFDVLRIFGVIGDDSKGKSDEELMKGEGGELIHAAYLWMARAGLAALEHYDIASRKWGQAHMQARFSILRVLLERGDGVAKLEFTDKNDGRITDLCVRIDRSKILNQGRKSMDGYLQELHISKAIADVDGARKLFVGLTDLVQWAGSEERLKMFREEVLRKKVPRKIFVQMGTELVSDGKDVKIREYESTPAGMIQSFVDRENDVASL